MEIRSKRRSKGRENESLAVSRGALRVDAREGGLRKLLVMALRWPITNRVYTDSAGFHVSSSPSYNLALLESSTCNTFSLRNVFPFITIIGKRIVKREPQRRLCIKKNKIFKMDLGKFRLISGKLIVETRIANCKLWNGKKRKFGKI